MKMNLPNKLTVLRLCLVPVFMAVMLFSDSLAGGIAGLLIFIGASVTDMLDGKIARKYHLVTDFGKLLDPLADKFMTIGALMVILYRAMMADEPNTLFCILLFCGVLFVVFRELAITSLRLMVAGTAQSGEKRELAANLLGKIKTCTQIAAVIACIAEETAYRFIPALEFLNEIRPLSYLTVGLMIVFTIWSGINYGIGYWKFLDPKT